MPRSKEDLATSLGNFIHRRFKVDIPASAWQETALPEHLKMRFAVAGPDGKTVAIGRDAALLRKVAPALSPGSPPVEVRQRWEREGITTWDFGDLPESIAADEDDTTSEVFFPALVRPEEGQTGVGLKLFNTHEEALKVHCDGVAAFLEITLAGDLRYLKRQLRLPPELARRVRFPGGAKGLEKQLYDRVLSNRLRCNLRTADAFDTHAAKVRKVLIRDGQQLIEAITPVLTTLDEVREILFGLEKPSGGQGPVAGFLRERRGEIDKLVPENFVAIYDRERLPHLARYLRAVALRSQRAVLQLDRDRPKAEEVARFTNTLQSFLEALTPRTSDRKRAALEALFWLIEEYKVSLFAQELKTAVPVSAKRLEKKVAEIRRMA
jgi:ATP-dependent helicase HrpA